MINARVLCNAGMTRIENSYKAAGSASRCVLGRATGLASAVPRDVQNDLGSFWESWTARKSCQIPINSNKRQLCLHISALKSGVLKLLEVFLEVLCWCFPHMEEWV